MGRVWVDVFDAAGNRLGDGAVQSIQSAEITRVLDGAGSFRLTASGTDRRANALLQNENRVQIWREDIGGKRLAGQGIIRKRYINDNQTGVTLRADGIDILDELRRRNTLLARIYSQDTVTDVVTDLISLVPGWSVSVDTAIASDLVDLRFDGVSVLRALIVLTEQYGLHFRLSTTAPKTVEVGLFGDSNGLHINRVEYINVETLNNPDLLIVQDISSADDSEELCNWLLPVGAGEGTAALTLEHSDRVTPYTIQTVTGADGTTLYYISDSASITTFGELRKVAQFKEIAPLSNSETDIRNAANALYDAAVIYLERHKDIKKDYAVTVKNAQTALQAGDKVRVDYKARVTASDGQALDYLNVTGDFWVMDVRESVGLDESAVNLVVSNIDRPVYDEAEVIIGALERIELRGLKPEISSGARSYVYDRELAPSFPAVVPVEFTDATLELQRIRLRIRTSPFRTTSQGGAAGGNHSHRVFVYSTNTPSGFFSNKLYVGRNSPAGGFIEHSIASNHTSDIWTYDASGDHTHPPIYGIADDTQTPQNVTVWVNGINRTPALFGSATIATSSGNSPINLIADVGQLTNFIINAVGGLRQAHTIEVRCANQRGRVEVTVEVFEVTQSIKLGT